MSASLQVPAHGHPDAEAVSTSPSPRQALPTFSSLGQNHNREDSRRSDSFDDGRAESSASGSIRSRSHGGSKDRGRGMTGMLDKHDSIGSSSGTAFSRKGMFTEGGPTPDRERQEAAVTAHAHPVRRGSNRSSGGFLLGSIGKGSRIPKILQGKNTKLTEGDRKGSKSTGATNRDDSEEIQHTPLSKLRSSHSRPSSSIGSSPLSSEVKPDAVESKGNGTLIPKPSNGQLRPSSPLARRSGSLEVPEQRIEIKKRPTTSVGYDTDPAQIVNMALSLSEARRRQASERRYVSGVQPGRQRVVSTASAPGSRNKHQSIGSVAQYLQAQRTPSARSAGAQTPKLSTDNRRASQVGTPEVPIGDENSLADDFDQEVSDATKARVEKARVFFELAYEHRRLLSHLPPIRRPGTDVNPGDPDKQSKAYNPLQYIRNRKLRIWDKTTIDAEAEGWHDVEKVRSWVNAVIESHTETRHDPAQVVRLPPLAKSDGSSDSREASQHGSKESQQGQGRHDHQLIRPRRPRSDWVTHPGDIIGDCFWLEQGMNKLKIQDRDNNNIYPPNTQFMFSGWRNRTPAHVPEGLQQPSPPPEPEDPMEEEAHEPLHPVSELPTFRSAHQHAFGQGVSRRKRNKIKDSIAAADDRGLTKGIKVFMEDSDSNSSGRSSRSESPPAERGRKRLRKRQKQELDISPGQLPPPPPPRHPAPVDPTHASDQSLPSSKQNSKRTSVDHGTSLGRFLKRESHPKNPTPVSRSMTRAEHRRQESAFKFPGLDERPRSSGEYDSTAPNSPVHPRWPSIAINLDSPPHSRSPSPSKRHIPSILKPLHRHHKNESVQEKDFGDNSKRSSVAVGTGEEGPRDGSRDLSRGTSPMTRGESPTTKKDTHAAVAPPASEHTGMSKVNTKSTAASSDHSKIRGIFKGGRIAEIVGHEVSRVGDFIWKKDAPAPYKRRDSELSGKSGYESDGEDEPVNGTVIKTPPGPKIRSRSSTLSSTKSDTSPVVSNKSPVGSGGRPKYNNPNLPSFTSPFDRDREDQQRKQAMLTPPTSDSHDHISRLAAEHRSASRSPRLDRLAPPRLDTGDRSRSPNRLEHWNSNVSGAALNLTPSQSASDKLNTALTDGASPGLAAVKSRHSAIDISRISTHDLDHESPYVTWRDIQRAGAFILSSAVKAKEICRRADEPRQMPSFMADAISNGDKPATDLAMVARKQEHVIAARSIMHQITEQAGNFDESLKHFTGMLAPQLHRQLQELEDLVDNQMTPRVRNSADEAGELSMKLSTTSTMAIKGVNEAIDQAMMRRRRGPVRWVRRAWYASIEYTVVGLLWAIWAVVSVVRVLLLIITGTTRTARWMLWLD